MGRLEGKVVIITGGARGQGASEARLFTEEGATVYITDVLADEGAKTRRRHRVHIPHATTSPQPGEWEQVIGRVVAERGRIDVLINNAGILHWAPMTTTPLDVWERVIAVNQTGVFLGMQAVAPHDERATLWFDHQHLVDRRDARRLRRASRTPRPSGRCAA